MLQLEVGIFLGSLGSSFWLYLNTPDVDQIFYKNNNCDYWGNMKPSLAWTVVICNYIMLSTLWSFL